MERSDIMSGKIITRIVSSLEKALADTRPENYPALEKQSALLGETLDFQLLVLDNDESIPSSRRLTLSVTGMPGEYSVREAVSVFCDFPTYRHDTSRGTPYYIDSKTGTYPDILQPTDGNFIRPVPGRTTSLWFTLTPENAGEHRISITLSDGENVVAENTLSLTVVPAELPGAEADIHPVVPLRLPCVVLQRSGIFGASLGDYRGIHEMRGEKRDELHSHPDTHPAA